MMDQNAVNSQRRRLPSEWKLARVELDVAPGSEAEWFPATVPGAVQLDWARAKGLPDHNYGQNVRRYDGLEDSAWLYRTEIPAVALTAGQRLFLTCGGVDFECEVRIGGQLVLRHRGMQVPFEMDASGYPPGTAVEILILPAPKRHSVPADKSQASHVTKPAMSYGWDWHPRLIPLGLHTETGFEIKPAQYLREVDFRAVLNEDLSAAEITVSVTTAPSDCDHTWRLVNREGATVLTGEGPQARMVSPRLWWTHDQGDPYLYDLEVTLAGGDTYRRKVGFRRVRLVMHSGAWDEDLGFPKTRNNPPMTLELNGRRIFAKGSNWVAPDIFPGRINADTYRPLLRLAHDANFNLLRNWGGAAAPAESFYEQCDELGLLVWQEFPLACNLYPDDPDYLRLLDAESRAIIRRASRHPCLALWSGGNELFNAWSRMTDQSLPLRLLNRNCYDLDLHTPFIPTSPVMGVGHGDYRFLSEGRDIYAVFQQARCTAYTEFGCPGASPVDYLKQYLPPEELWPPRPGSSWETHHGLGAWAPPEPTSWLCLTTLEAIFGPIPSLEDAVEKSTWLQCEGYKSVYEEARRQQPRCGMALSWCFNEPWPSAANNSLVNWPAQPKPALASVALACRPVLVSARIPRFQWQSGDRFEAELWILNDRPEAQPGGRVLAELVAGELRVQLAAWDFPVVPAQTQIKGPDIATTLPEFPDKQFELRLLSSPDNTWSSSYRLVFAGSNRATKEEDQGWRYESPRTGQGLKP